MYYKSIGVLEKDAGITKTKIRGVLSLLKQSGVLSTTNLEDETPVKLELDPKVFSIIDLRRLHDAFLGECMSSFFLTNLDFKERESMVWDKNEIALRNRIRELSKFEQMMKQAFSDEGYVAYLLLEQEKLMSEQRANQEQQEAELETESDSSSNSSNKPVVATEAIHDKEASKISYIPMEMCSGAAYLLCIAYTNLISGQSYFGTRCYNEDVSGARNNAEPNRLSSTQQRSESSHTSSMLSVAAHPFYSDKVCSWNMCMHYLITLPSKDWTRFD